MKNSRSIAVIKKVEVKIVSSGYSDRFVYTTCQFELSMIANNRRVVTTLSTRDHLIGLLCTLGYSFNHACNWPIAVQYFMVGYKGERYKDFIRVTVNENTVKSIHLYIELTNKDRCTADAVQQKEEYLKLNPIPNTIMDIIQYQMSECDRLNTLHWGSPNGRQI